MNKIHHSILYNPYVQEIQEKVKERLSEGAEYTCDICWKNFFKTSVKRLNESKYTDALKNYEKCCQGISDYICNPCHSRLVRNEMPADAIANNLSIDERIDEIASLNDIEVALISQILPFMCVVARHKGAQVGLKGQLVLVPTDLDKIQKALPRTSNTDHLITVALKRRLQDNSSYIKQHISPAKINTALAWLHQNNPLYADVVSVDDWESAMQSEDPELWSMLTDDGKLTKQVNSQQMSLTLIPTTMMAVLIKNKFIKVECHNHH